VFGEFADAVRLYGGRLLLLGEPGSGKTTTLLLYVRELIQDCLTIPDAPVPVLASIHCWDEVTPVREWALKEASIPPHSGLRRKDLVFLLDGLDELVDPAPMLVRVMRGEVGGAASWEFQRATRDHSRQTRFLEQAGDAFAADKVIVTCRTEDYRRLHQKIRLTGAVVLEPLTTAQVRTYLLSLGQNQLFQQLLVDPQWLVFCRLPLHLFIAASVGRLGQRLPSFPVDRPDAVLVELFVKSKLRHERRGEAHSPRDDHVIDTLSVVAACMLHPRQVWSRRQIDTDTVCRVFGRRFRRVIDYCAARSLFVRNEGRFIEFTHASFRDYFAARAFSRDLWTVIPYWNPLARWNASQYGDGFVVGHQPLIWHFATTRAWTLRALRELGVEVNARSLERSLRRWIRYGRYAMRLRNSLRAWLPLTCYVLLAVSLLGNLLAGSLLSNWWAPVALLLLCWAAVLLPVSRALAPDDAMFTAVSEELLYSLGASRDARAAELLAVIALQERPAIGHHALNALLARRDDTSVAAALSLVAFGPLDLVWPACSYLAGLKRLDLVPLLLTEASMHRGGESRETAAEWRRLLESAVGPGQVTAWDIEDVEEWRRIMVLSAILAIFSATNTTLEAVTCRAPSTGDERLRSLAGAALARVTGQAPPSFVQLCEGDDGGPELVSLTAKLQKWERIIETGLVFIQAPPVTGLDTDEDLRKEKLRRLLDLAGLFDADRPPATRQ
jgi:hypothetical protein